MANEKHFAKTIKPIRVSLNEFIQTQKRYPTSPDKNITLT